TNGQTKEATALMSAPITAPKISTDATCATRSSEVCPKCGPEKPPAIRKMVNTVNSSALTGCTGGTGSMSSARPSSSQPIPATSPEYSNRDLMGVFTEGIMLIRDGQNNPNLRPSPAASQLLLEHWMPGPMLDNDVPYNRGDVP